MPKTRKIGPGVLLCVHFRTPRGALNSWPPNARIVAYKDTYLRQKTSILVRERASAGADSIVSERTIGGFSFASVYSRVENARTVALQDRFFAFLAILRSHLHA